MAPLTEENKIATDWYEETCQRLNTLRQDYSCPDPGEVMPCEELFQRAKEFLSDLREVSGFPSVPTPDVWVSPCGKIGLTWDISKESDYLELEIEFGKNGLTSIRLTEDERQSLVTLRDVSSVFRRFAA